MNVSSHVVMSFVFALASVACDDPGGDSRGTSDAGADGAGDVGASNVGCKQVGTDHCMCVEDPTPDWDAPACSPATVEQESSDTGFCCDGYFCDCKAVTCRYSQGFDRCMCTQSTVAAVAGGVTVTTCPNANGPEIKCCKSSGSCTCSKTSCLAGLETEVASCGLADVMECEDKQPVDACL